MSSNKEEEDQKKRSQAIDRALDEDSKRLRRECKILLLGKLYSQLGYLRMLLGVDLRRLGREWKVHDRQADEDHPSQGILGG